MSSARTEAVGVQASCWNSVRGSRASEDTITVRPPREVSTGSGATGTSKTYSSEWEMNRGSFGRGFRGRGRGNFENQRGFKNFNYRGTRGGRGFYGNNRGRGQFRGNPRGGFRGVRGGMNSERVEEKEEKVIEERRNVKERLGTRDSYVAAEIADEPRKSMSAKAQRFLNQEQTERFSAENGDANGDDNEDDK